MTDMAGVAGGDEAVGSEETGAETVRVAGTEIRAADLPWWRRPRKLRRQLVATLVIVAFVSVALIGGLNFVAARRLLDDGTKEQLTSIGEARARSIETGIARTEDAASAAAADLAVVRALEDLSAAFDTRSTGRLDDAQLAELDEFYERTVVAPIADAGLGTVSVEDLRPGTDAGRYLQYHYTMPNADDPDVRPSVSDPGDGSAYTEAHTRHHETLSVLAESLGFGDLMLVSADTGAIVYSTDKRIDFGTGLSDGPYADGELGRTVRDELPAVPIGQGVLTDQERYLPAEGRPVFFVAATVRSEQEVIGVLVLEIPVEGLNAITTADERWEDVGLRNGESYVVGSDLLLRSESRRWIEDPQGYLDRVDDEELVRLIEIFDSPVGLQPVDTEPVEASLDGEPFEGTARNYLRQSTYSYATPIDATGVDWVVVTDVPLSDARAPLLDYARRVGLVFLIVLPIAGLVGYVMADRLTRPIHPVMRAARAVAAGDRDPDLPDLGRDEFGDLARRLRLMANELGAREAELADEYEERRRLFLAVLPPHVVEPDGQLTDSGEVADVATVVAVRLDVVGDEVTSADDEISELLARAARTAEVSAEEAGIQRIRAGADAYLFLAGVGADDGAEAALDFAVGLATAIPEVSDDEDVALSVHVGLSTGPVATGVLERGNLTFAAWGEPIRRALAIGALAMSDEILVDATTSAAVGDDRWGLREATDVVDLDGQPMDLFSVSRA